MMSSVACGTAGAQTYPSKPVRIMVPFSAGGGSDLIGRVLAQELSGVLGQTMLIDNRTGAGGHIGIEIVTRANNLLSEMERYRRLVKAIGLKLQ
jgi:tripartite-type tricarboxylate transporter receptor subunit TctC